MQITHRAAALVAAILLSALAVPPYRAARERSPRETVRAGLEAERRGEATDEYALRPLASSDGAEPAWESANHAQRFRAIHDRSGVRVLARDGDAGAPGSWEWGLRLLRAGHDGSLHALGAGAPVVEGNRIELRRGEVTEWFANDRRGLQHGFVVQDVVDDGDGPLVLDLGLEGALSAALASDARSIRFRAADGSGVLRYRDLQARDAEGTQLDARFECSSAAGSRRVRIVVDDIGAVYPIVVDPIVTGFEWSAQSEVPEAGFGVAVAVAGDVDADGFSDIVVGAPNFGGGASGAGRVFVFLGGPGGLPTEADWSASGPAAAGDFGSTVGAAGDVNGDGFSDLVVGAPGHSNGQLDEGAAFVYLGGIDGIRPGPAWVFEGGQAGARLGAAVSAAGDVNGDGFADVLIGSPGFDASHVDGGRVLLFYGSAAGLGSTPGRVVLGDQAGAALGSAVSTAGDVNGDGFADILAGAPGRDGAGADQGRAILLVGSGSGVVPGAAWSADGSQGGAMLGAALATAGDVNGDGYSDVVVGAPGFGGANPAAGRALVYLGGPGGLGSAPTWTMSTDETDARFGRAVGTAGDLNGDGYADVIVGASGADADEIDAGRAFVYFGSAAGPASAPSWSGAADQPGALYGDAVATAGDVDGDGYADVIVGAGAYAGGGTGGGAAFVYYGSPAGVAAESGWRGERDQAGAGLGWAVASAGDVDGDGFADLLVAAPFWEQGLPDEGAAFVYRGSPSGPGAAPVWSATGGQASATFGASVAAAGDVNGDGYGDILVGSDFYSNGEALEGTAFAYYGSPAGPATSPSWSVESDQAGAQMALALDGAGDVNGDGFADVVVGVWAWDGESSDEGLALVYHGSAGGLSTVPAWSFEGGQPGAAFGRSVAAAGDVNGDGYGDVLVGAYRHGDSVAGAGRAYLFLGSPQGLSPVPAWVGQGSGAHAWYGWTVASAGDLNGDGFGDVAVGAPRHASTGGRVGRVEVYLGSALGIGAAPDWFVEGDEPYAEFGHSVAAAGDLDGDGYGELAVGARFAGGDSPFAGRVSVYRGSATGPAPGAAWVREGDADFARFGEAVDSAGDVNGDGHPDLVVGATNEAAPDPGEGTVSLFFGNGAAGVLRLPQQRRADDGAPIAPLGMSDDLAGYRLVLRGRSPFGRTRVKLQWEVEPLGRPFDGVGVKTAAAWADSGLDGAALNEVVQDLGDGAVHRARVRVLYHPASSPYLQAGRWTVLPINGPEEGDLRTRDCSGADLDFDGYARPLDPACPGGATVDCDDASAASHPGALERCDAQDNDCDGAADEDEVGVAPDGTAWVRSCRRFERPVEPTPVEGAGRREPRRKRGIEAPAPHR